MNGDKTIVHPLNEQHCACLDKVLANTANSLDLARACADCGLPMDEFIEQLRAQQEMAKRLKAKFFPNRV